MRSAAIRPGASCLSLSYWVTEMMNHMRASISLIGLLAIAGSASCQTSSTAPDALILIQPTGPAALIAITYPKAVSHDVVRSRLARLASLLGGRISSVEIRDEDARSIDKSLGKQTGADAIMTNAFQVKQGGFVLQPYIEAFSDVNRLEILYWTAPFKGFSGIREFDNPSIHVRLLRAGGPYHYEVQIRDHTRPLPLLPIVQPAVPGTVQAQRPAPASSGSNWSGILFVVAVAAGSGLAVLLALLTWSRLKDRSPVHAHSRRASR